MKSSLAFVTAVALAWAATARADLYVARGYGGGRPTAVLRFSEITGAFINQIEAGVGAEAFLGVEVAPNGEVFALDNTLGYAFVHRFAPNLNYLGKFGSAGPNLLAAYGGITVDPQNNVLVAARLGNLGAPGAPGIFQLDAASGQLTGTTPFASAPGMSQPYDLQFGPSGHLFISDHTLGVLEFDGSTGAYLRTVVPTDPVKLFNVTGIAFGPNGDLFIASSGNKSILRYHLTTDLLEVFIAPGSGGLVNPGDIDFGPDGNLYIADRQLHTVLRFRGSDGAPLGEFTQSGAGAFGLGGPDFLSFTPFAATGFHITGVAHEPGILRLTHESEANSYYIAYRSRNVTDPFQQPVDMALGQNGVGQLIDAAAPTPTAFYRVSRLPLDSKLDTDGDGMPNVWELKYALNPLQDDARTDFDADGTDNATEYLQGRNPTKGVIADSGNVVGLQVFSPLENQTQR